MFISCPFHDEKTPSMLVNSDGGSGWAHCYGCKKNADIIDFYVKLEGVSFSEAVRRLSNGVNVNFDLSILLNGMDDKPEESDGDLMDGINIMVSRFCFDFLRSLKVEKMSEEIVDREFSKIDKVMNRFDECIELADVDGVMKISEFICDSDFLIKRLQNLREEIRYE